MITDSLESNLSSLIMNFGEKFKDDSIITQGLKQIRTIQKKKTEQWTQIIDHVNELGSSNNTSSRSRSYSESTLSSLNTEINSFLDNFFESKLISQLNKHQCQVLSKQSTFRSNSNILSGGSNYVNMSSNSHSHSELNMFNFSQNMVLQSQKTKDLEIKLPSQNLSTHGNTFIYSEDSNITMLSQKTDGILSHKPEPVNGNFGQFQGQVSNLERIEMKLNMMMQMFSNENINKSGLVSNNGQKLFSKKDDIQDEQFSSPESKLSEILDTVTSNKSVLAKIDSKLSSDKFLQVQNLPKIGVLSSKSKSHRNSENTNSRSQSRNLNRTFQQQGNQEAQNSDQNQSMMLNTPKQVPNESKLGTNTKSSYLHPTKNRSSFKRNRD